MKKQNKKTDSVSRRYSVISGLLLLICIISYKCFIGPHLLNNRHESPTVVSGFFGWQDGGVTFNYDFSADGTFEENIYTNMGSMSGKGKYYIDGDEVILEGVNPIGGSSTMRIPLNSIIK